MGIDRDGIGGIGILVDQEVVEKMITKGIFTEDEWEDDPLECLDMTMIPHATAGDGSYTGDDDIFYFMIDGNTLNEINRNVPDFIKRLNEVGVSIKEEELIVISDIHVW